MGFFQRMLSSLLPKRTVDAMKAESEDWMLQCKCGHATSIWALGGVRYGAVSKGKRTMIKCQKCGKRTWHRYYRKSEGQPPA